MQSGKAIISIWLLPFLLWAREYTKNGALNCNEDNDGAQTQVSLRSGRMLYERGGLQNDTDVSITSLARVDNFYSRSRSGSVFNRRVARPTHSIYSGSKGKTCGNIGNVHYKSSIKESFDNDFESCIGTTSTNAPKSVARSISTFHVDTSRKGSHEDVASNKQSTIDESILFDIPDNSSVSSHNSGSTTWSTTTGANTGSGSTTMDSFHKRQRSKYYDSSYEDLQTVEEREKMKRAKEMAQRKKILDESTYDLENVRNSFKGHSNKYYIQNKDKYIYEFKSEESLNERLKELNAVKQESLQDVKKGSKKSKKSKRRAECEGEFSSYLSNDKIDQADDSILDVNHNNKLLRKLTEFNAEDREQMRKALNNIKKNNRKNAKLEDLEHELRSQLEGLTKYVNVDDDARSSISGSTDDSMPESDNVSSIYVGKRRMEDRSNERTGNNITELRSYIDQVMDANNAEIAHLLINKIEEYEKEVSKLKENNRKEVNFINMKHNLKLRKILLSVPLIALVTSAILCFFLTQYWALAFITVFCISLYSFVIGTLFSYIILGKVMFNSPSKVIDFMLGQN
ncbi:hypothetical protein AK88_04695 [Plasmodium fragile]|uniref:Pv-fam-d protein n=1 Tax=Plasmodium fragile TaxID=5857 RepID=A0A0D9QF98_PLAFR|nr:uncharacterized protein AK88_04695 [Plasmodium fragile]KJP85664.1 hypothetical protein AK88_04695 [Plasmodium fragile]